MFPSSTSSGSARLLAIGALLLGLGALVAFVVWRRSPRSNSLLGSPPPDPRLAYTGRFRNVHPDVAYVGSAVCGECHVAETQSYRAHPMGRSLAPIREFLDHIPSDDKDAGFTLFGSRFRLEWQGDQLVPPERDLGTLSGIHARTIPWTAPRRRVSVLSRPSGTATAGYGQRL